MIKISALPAATALLGTEILPLVQAGVTKQTTLQLIRGNLTSSQSASGATAVFTVPTYIQGGSLLVFRNGVLQALTDDYTETSTTQITFTFTPSIGDKITVR